MTEITRVSFTSKEPWHRDNQVFKSRRLGHRILFPRRNSRLQSCLPCPPALTSFLVNGKYEFQRLIIFLYKSTSYSTPCLCDANVSSHGTSIVDSKHSNIVSTRIAGMIVTFVQGTFKEPMSNLSSDTSL